MTQEPCPVFPFDTLCSMPTRVFLTGATGFVGTNLCPMLLDRGYELRCLIRPGKKAPELNRPGVEKVEGTIEDTGILREAMRGIDQVIHLAAVVSFRKQDRARSFEINVGGTERMTKLAREAGVTRFLHTSSIAAVGYSSKPIELDETTPFNLGPLRIGYCDSKQAAELVVLEEVKRGLDAVIVNPASMFGPGDRRKAKGSLLEKAAYGRVKFCLPGGSAFADVRDVAAGCIAALERGRTGERYILGGQNVTNRQLIQKIYSVLGRTPPRFTMPAFLLKGLAIGATVWEKFRPLAPPLTAEILRLAPRYTWFTSRKAEEELGYAAYPIEMGIKAAYDWMLDLDLIDHKKMQALGRT